MAKICSDSHGMDCKSQLFCYVPDGMQSNLLDTYTRITTLSDISNCQSATCMTNTQDSFEAKFEKKIMYFDGVHYLADTQLYSLAKSMNDVSHFLHKGLKKQNTDDSIVHRHVSFYNKTNSMSKIFL